MNVCEQKCIQELVREVVGCAYRVSNCLGSGFLEKVYERALMIELQHAQLDPVQQCQFPLSYRGQPIGTYVADLIVDNRLIVEIKCVESFRNEHLAQCLNYLRASGLNSALHINFQHPRVQWKKVTSNPI